MSGYAAPIDTLSSHPRRFFVRLLLVSLVLLALTRTYSTEIVALLLPAMAAEMTALDDNVSIRSLELGHDGPGDTVRLRANLVRPFHFKSWVAYPLGWTSHADGWYQVDINARAVLQSSLILIIAVLAWPQRALGEFIARVLIAVPFTVILFALDTPLNLLGNFQEAVVRDLDPLSTCPLFAWGKFLEGGGRIALALAFAVIAISLAAPGPGPRFRERVTQRNISIS
jgi:hypothetical protein